MFPVPPIAKSNNSFKVTSFDELVPPGKVLFNPRKVVNGTLNAPCDKALAIIKPCAVLLIDSFGLRRVRLVDFVKRPFLLRLVAMS